VRKFAVFDRLVVNASPLIFLSRVDGLDWVARLSAQAARIPHAVVAEVEAGLGGKAIIDTIRGDRRFEIVPDAPVPPLVAAWDLGAGESQVLADCMRQPGVTAVLDDRAARGCAQSAANVGVIGTLGIVLAARRRGWINLAGPVIESLVKDGMFLSRELIAAALQAVGE
jgi:predicted nucleic acid-binding protein